MVRRKRSATGIDTGEGLDAEAITSVEGNASAQVQAARRPAAPDRLVRSRTPRGTAPQSLPPHDRLPQVETLAEASDHGRLPLKHGCAPTSLDPYRDQDVRTSRTGHEDADREWETRMIEAVRDQWVIAAGIVLLLVAAAIWWRNR